MFQDDRPARVLQSVPEQESIQFMQATAAGGRQIVGFSSGLPATPNLLISFNVIAPHDGTLDRVNVGNRASQRRPVVGAG